MELVRLGQLHKVARFSKELKAELANKLNIQYCIPNNTFKNLEKKSYDGYNCLHLAAMTLDFDLISELLKHGADFLKQGTKDLRTPLHVAVNAKRSHIGRRIWEMNGKLQEYLIFNAFLIAQVKINNTFNPKCMYGISHFHIACMFNCVEAVQFFLKNGEPINQVTKADAHWPSYTSLHFAMRYSSVETAEILLTKGADLLAKNGKGTSPLQILINRLLNIADYITMGQYTLSSPHEEFQRLETIGTILIKSRGRDSVNILDDTGLTTFHIACILKNTSIVESFLYGDFNLNMPIKTDSKFWPGWTPLHFAACSNPKTVKLLVKRGADITVKNKKGETPLDMCLKRYSPRIVHSILSIKEEFKNTLLSDNSTKLLDLILAMNDIASLLYFLENLHQLNVTVNPTSPFLPGYSILHLAISMNETMQSWNDFIAKMDIQSPIDSIPPTSNYADDESLSYSDRIHACLTMGCSVNLRNLDGLSPIHLAFKTHRIRWNVLDQLLNHCHEDVTDHEGLSHLHIACAIGNQPAVENLLNSGAKLGATTTKSFKWYKRPFSVNVAPKLIEVKANSTPLHLAVQFEQLGVVDFLLGSFADPFAKDADGYTPVHLSMGSNHVSKVIVGKLEDFAEMVTKEGLSHLHVAVFSGRVESTRKFICNGANVNARISDEVPEFLSSFAGKTPLQIGIDGKVALTVETLIEFGADVHVNDALRCLMDESKFAITRHIVAELNEDANEPIDSSGLTLLRVACSRCDVNWATQLLKRGADANARIRDDEDYRGPWKGYTPLHALVRRKNFSSGDPAVQSTIDELSNLLFEFHADVTIDSEDGTPLHMVYCEYLRQRDVEEMQDRSRENPSHDYLAASMLYRHSNVQINPISPDGFSHFHFYCTIDDKEDLVGRYLDSGVDVDHSTNPFAKNFAGYTALHFAIQYEAFKVANLLIERGADVNVENADGNTPLHLVISQDGIHTQRTFIESLTSHGANFNAKNLKGETPVDVLMTKKMFNVEQLHFLLTKGSSISLKKSSSSLGPAALIMQNTTVLKRMEIFKLFISICDVRTAVKNGYNPIQDVVIAKNNRSDLEDKDKLLGDDYLEIILEFVRMGCEVDQPDDRGLTALHHAVVLDNVDAVRALIQLGADVNACKVDRSIFQRSASKFNIAIQVHKMYILGLDVTFASDSIYAQFNLTGEDVEMLVAMELERAEMIQFTRVFTLRSFLSESWVARSSRLASADREGIDVFFNDYDYLLEQFPVLCGLMLSQYKKAVVRPRLMAIARDVLASDCNVYLPDLCWDRLSSYMTNDALKYLIDHSSRAMSLL